MMKHQIVAGFAAVLFSLATFGQATPVTSTPGQAQTPVNHESSARHSGKAKTHHAKAHHKSHKRHHKAA